MNHQHLEQTLRQLRLSGLSQTLNVRLQEAAANRLSHAEFLELLCQDELAVRQERLLKRRTQAADFHHLKTLEDFDWQFNPAIHRKVIYELAAGAFIRQSTDVFFVGRRYENRSTIMTSNRPLEEWGKLLGDVPSASAILDRFLHHAQVIAITGRSYRLKDQPLAGKEAKKATKPHEPPTAGSAS
jgi:DNA replication protein DnaC